MESGPKAREPNQDIEMGCDASAADLRDVLESIARDLEKRAGNATYQQAYKKAAIVVRSYQRCKLYVPIQTDGSSKQSA
jgi:hypothetical protein